MCISVVYLLPAGRVSLDGWYCDVGGWATGSDLSWLALLRPGYHGPAQINLLYE